MPGTPRNELDGDPIRRMPVADAGRSFSDDANTIEARRLLMCDAVVEPLRSRIVCSSSL
jgi:hypothetical protein